MRRVHATRWASVRGRRLRWAGTAARPDRTFLCDGFDPDFSQLPRWRCDDACSNSGGPIFARLLLGGDGTRDLADDGAGPTGFVLAADDGSCEGMEPVAARPACRRARGRRRAPADPPGWMHGRSPHTGVRGPWHELCVERSERSRWGGSGGWRYRKNMAPLKEVFGTALLHGTGSGVGHEHGSGAMRGVRGGRSPRSLIKQPIRIACVCSGRSGGHKCRSATTSRVQAISTGASVFAQFGGFREVGTGAGFARSARSRDVRAGAPFARSAPSRGEGVGRASRGRGVDCAASEIGRPGSAGLQRKGI